MFCNTERTKYITFSLYEDGMKQHNRNIVVIQSSNDDNIYTMHVWIYGEMAEAENKHSVAAATAAAAQTAAMKQLYEQIYK